MTLHDYETRARSHSIRGKPPGRPQVDYLEHKSQNIPEPRTSGSENPAMSCDSKPDAIQELLAEFNGELSWNLIAKVETFLGKLVIRGPSARTRTAVAAFSHRVKALERWVARAAETLRDKESATRRRNPSRNGTPARNGSTPHQGPQTLGELVLQECGPDSEAWKKFQRLNRMFGVSTPEDLERATKREQALLERYAGKATQLGQSAST